VDLIAAPEGLVGRVEYSTDLFEPATVAGMARRLETLLEDLAADPDRRLAALTAASRCDLPALDALNQTAVAWEGTPLLHELVAEQAARTPHAIAVEAADGTPTTYAHLLERARRLAHALAASGVGPGDLVGVCLDRSPALVV